MSEIYQNVCETLYPNNKPRNLLQKTLDALDKNVQNGCPPILLEAPTGYGKSTLSLTIYLAIRLGRRDLGQRVIHVLPMRSIGSHMYKRMTDEYLPRLESSGFPVRRNDVGLQQMSSPGSPMLCKSFVITTLDTFVSSFYKMPPIELEKLLTRGTAHYEVPRGCIYSSIVVFDEFHLYTVAKALTDGKSKTLTAALACIIGLLEMGVPVIISTATMPQVIKDTIIDELETIFGDKLIIISPSLADLSFIKRIVKVKTIGKDEWLETVERNLNNEKRLLIVTNTVHNAAQIYNTLKSRNIVAKIIHSRIIEREKESRLKEIEFGPCIVVSTQVLEAGVDMSFDIIITEAAPPDSILQRGGRVARYGGEGELYVYPLSEGGEKIYGRELPVLTYERLKKMNELSYDLLDIYGDFEKPELIDRELFDQLRKIDVYPSYSAKVATGIWRVYCGFARESEMVSVVPRIFIEKFMSNPRERSQYIFTIDDSLFNKLISNGSIKKYLTESNEIKPIDELMFSKECFSEIFLKYGVSAVILEDYDEEVGLYL